MSTTFRGVGGIGVYVTEDMELILRNRAKESTYENINVDDYRLDEILSSLSVDYIEFGDLRNCDNDLVNKGFALVIREKNCLEAFNQIPKFLFLLNSYGIKVDINDLIIIKEMYIKETIFIGTTKRKEFLLSKNL